MLLIFLFYGLLPCVSGLALIFLLLSFSVQFLFREVLLPHCRFKGYNPIKYLKYLVNTLSKGHGRFYVHAILLLDEGESRKLQYFYSGSVRSELLLVAMNVFLL